MYKCSCLTKNDVYVDEIAYNINEWDLYLKQPKIIETEKNYIINHFATFDIETTTINDNINTPYAYMYQWQFCIDDTVIFGKTFNDLTNFFERFTDFFKLDKKHKMIIYVHNLSFEFQFIKQFFNITKLFARNKHSIVSFILNDVFEFRCSYCLSNQPLQQLCINNNTYYRKGRGDLDYRQKRTPNTELTPIEYGYCYNDVRALHERIEYYLKNDSLKSIPKTSTGFVRRDCREQVQQNKYNRKLFKKNQLTEQEYKLLKERYRGGNTHANRYMTGFIIDDVISYDISSSYPFVMLSEKFPTGKYIHIDNIDFKQRCEYSQKFCTCATYTFYNIDSKDNNYIPYIPFSKCYDLDNFTIYNGRILKRDKLTISLLDVDLEIILDTYTFEKVEVTNFMYCWKIFLPLELRQEIIKYYENKTKLKNVEGEEYNYMLSKQKLNGIYGMCVTDIIHDVITLLDDKTLDDTEHTTIDEYYNNFNNFLSYQWGVYVSAYARRNLQRAIKICDDSIIYVDTDSVKFVDYDGNIVKRIKELNQEIIDNCKKQNIIHSVKYNDKEIYLGIFDFDGHYKQFITLGAKKYRVIDDNNEIKVTVAGLSKKKGAEYLKTHNGLESFKIGTIFNDSGRTRAYYNEDKPHYITVDGEKIETASNIRIVDVPYTLGITTTMLEILENIGMGIENE